MGGSSARQCVRGLRSSTAMKPAMAARNRPTKVHRPKSIQYAAPRVYSSPARLICHSRNKATGVTASVAISEVSAPCIGPSSRAMYPAIAPPPISPRPPPMSGVKTRQRTREDQTRVSPRVCRNLNDKPTGILNRGPEIGGAKPSRPFVRRALEVPGPPAIPCLRGIRGKHRRRSRCS